MATAWVGTATEDDTVKTSSSENDPIEPQDDRTKSQLSQAVAPYVLLADDDSGIRESLSRLLQKEGYEVAAVPHGGDVLELLFREQFDLVILDLNMPHMDGWETLDRIQNLRPDLPVIILTAQSNQREWTRDAGARVLMEKPFSVPSMLATVHELLAERSMAAHPRQQPARWFKHLSTHRSTDLVTWENRSWGINE